MKKKRIFIVGGGTGGHLFPAIATAEELKNRGFDPLLITDTRCQKYLGDDLSIDYKILNIGSLGNNIYTKLFTLIRMVLAIYYSIFLILWKRPVAIIGFGSYISAPTLAAAKILHIPIILHEQNCFLGKVNKFFAKYAEIVALHFAETKNIPEAVKNEVVVVGNPVRTKFADIKKRAFKDEGINIVVIGGSQGASYFTEIIPEAIKILRQNNPDLPINLTQQVAEQEIDQLQDMYDKQKIKAVLQPFFHNIAEIYKKSDIVICRSGASTIAELIMLGQPAILVPFPHAAEDHQYFNAQVLASKTGCLSYRQEELSVEKLATDLTYFATNKSQLLKISNRLFGLKKDSASIFADTILRLLNK